MALCRENMMHCCVFCHRTTLSSPPTLAVELFDIDAIFNSMDWWRAGHPLKPHALVHGQSDLHEFACVQSKHGCLVSLGTAETFFSQRPTDTMAAGVRGHDKHSHDWPLKPKELCFGSARANIRDRTNNLPLNYCNNYLPNICKRGHIPDLCPERRPVLIRILELLESTESQCIDWHCVALQKIANYRHGCFRRLTCVTCGVPRLRGIPLERIVSALFNNFSTPAVIVTSIFLCQCFELKGSLFKLRKSSSMMRSATT